MLGQRKDMAGLSILGGHKARFLIVLRRLFLTIRTKLPREGQFNDQSLALVDLVWD